MKWWPWRKDPEVQQSIQDASKALQEVRRLAPEVRRVSAKMDEHVATNHWTESLIESFRRRA